MAITMKLIKEIKIESPLLANGSIVERENNSFHCTMNLKNGLSVLGEELIQGFGETPEKAILNTLNGTLSELTRTIPEPFIHSEKYSNGNFMGVIRLEESLIIFYGKGKTKKEALASVKKVSKESTTMLKDTIVKLLIEFKQTDK